MPSPEDELEAVIWAAMTVFRVTAAAPREFTDSIVAAAKRYSAGDSDELTRMRREVLNEKAAKA